jgi:hypothetical protein
MRPVTNTLDIVLYLKIFEYKIRKCSHNIGDLQFSIVPAAPEKSILIYRMNSLAPDEMMPELGRSLVHHEGLELIRHWIATMPGGC